MGKRRARWSEPVGRFSTNLKKAMQQRGFTQRSFAAALGTGHTQVNRVLQGEQSPTIEWASRAAKVLGVDVQELFERESELAAAN